MTRANAIEMVGAPSGALDLSHLSHAVRHAPDAIASQDIARDAFEMRAFDRIMSGPSSGHWMTIRPHGRKRRTLPAND